MILLFRVLKTTLFAIALGLVLFSCKKDDPPVTPDTPKPIDFSKLTDTYSDIKSEANAFSWGIHNVHDPIIRKFGDDFYSYSTDVGYGITVRPGIQIRKSTNLVEWKFIGWAFSDVPAKGAAYIESIGATPNNTIWAPSVIEVNGEYRMYYSLASNVGLKSCIGLATSTKPGSGWKEVDIVVASNPDGTDQTNAIDASVIITPEGQHWMIYGSSYDGIYILQLNAETGLALNPGDRGTRIAHRGFTNNVINGNIEGPEVIYNKDEGMYYLFIAYDWLMSKYNIRVGRSVNIEGPYTDMFGKDLFDKVDNYPMIVAPYKFNGHSGWQGVSHCTVFEEEGQYYVAHQGRPGIDKYYMNMHVRQLFWTKDGWPVASPERYAFQELSTFDESGISGTWEVIDFDYNVVPGFGDKQISPDFQTSSEIILNEDNTIGTSGSDTWSFDYPWLSVSLGGRTFDLHVSVGRDWENNVDSTLVMTGIKSDGLSYWGKKLNP